VVVLCRDFLDSLNLDYEVYFNAEHDRCYCQLCTAHIPDVLEQDFEHGHPYEESKGWSGFGLLVPWRAHSKEIQMSRVRRACLWRAQQAVPTSTDPKGILKNTREFKAPGADKEHSSEVRSSGRDPGVRRPGSGLGRPTARSKFL